MNQQAVATLLLICSVPLGAWPQLDLRADSVRSIEQNNFRFVEEGVEHRLFERSRYDEQGRLLQKDRYLYESNDDTGKVVVLHERIQYNPLSREGAVQTFRFPSPSRPKYRLATEQKTFFKSYDHDQRLLWRKRMDTAGEIRLETRFTYDSKDQLVARNEVDYVYEQPIRRKDEIEYNDWGKKTSWVSEDDSEAGERRVRDFSWDYDEQGRLLREAGYLNFNWKEADYKYKKGTLHKVIRRRGPRSPSGKVSYEYKILEQYDKEGRLVEANEWEFGKKVRSKTLSYEYHPLENEYIEKERIEDRSGKRLFIIRKEKHDGPRIKLKQVIENDVLEFEQRYQYRTNGKLKKRIEQERQGNGELWKTVSLYNEKEQILRVSHFVDDKLRREERYQYEYYESEEK